MDIGFSYINNLISELRSVDESKKIEIEFDHLNGVVLSYLSQLENKLEIRESDALDLSRLASRIDEIAYKKECLEALSKKIKTFMRSSFEGEILSDELEHKNKLIQVKDKAENLLFDCNCILNASEETGMLEIANAGIDIVMSAMQDIRISIEDMICDGRGKILVLIDYIMHMLENGFNKIIEVSTELKTLIDLLSTAIQNSMSEVKKKTKAFSAAVIGNGWGIISDSIHPAEVKNIAHAEVQTFTSDVDKAENDWRANEKYRLVVAQIRAALEVLLNETKDSPNDSNAQVRNLKSRIITDVPPLGAPSNGAPQELCEYHITRALYALENPNKFNNERDAFKAYKTCMRDALQTSFYQEQCQTVLSPHVQLLNKLAFTEFSQVHVQGFTESVAHKSAQKGGFKSIPIAHDAQSKLIGGQQQNMHSLKQILGDLDPYHRSIQNYSSTASSIRGEIFLFGLDSTMQGNPANVKCRMEAADGREITNVRTPSPTGQDGNVTPEFKAFLRELKAQGKTYTMINLQDRKNPGWWKYCMNRNGEYIRSASLEALQKEVEFAGMFTCFTLDKNSPFFEQENHHLVDTQSFKTEFMQNLQNPDAGFHIPPNFLDQKRILEIKLKLDMVHRTVFNKKDVLNQKERQDFIEVAYIFLADYYIAETGASYYNESCKDCIDRGGGANWTMMTLLNILEIFDPSRKHGNSADLKERIQNLSADLEADAIWARKRPVIYQRLERAHGAIEAMVKAIEENPDVVHAWAKELNFKKLIFNADTTQATKDPNFLA